MPRMRIWNPKEIAAYDNPPHFNTYQRKLFFHLPRSLEEKQSSLHNHTNQIGFCLMFGYFKAAKRFFSPARFHEQDIDFISRRLGVFSFGINISQYSRKTYQRHKKIILDHFGYQSYKAQSHGRVILSAIERQIHAQLRPKLIIDYLLEWLEKKRIESPPYNRLQTLITDAISLYKDQLLEKLKKHLKPKHKTALNLLFQQSGDPSNQPYLLTELKELIPSEKNKYIKANLEKLHRIWEIFDELKSLIKKLGLHADAIRYYGELVIHYRVSQINQKKELDQYLHLLAFVAYQVYTFEDWMMDTFLSGCKSALNLANKAVKDHLYEQRKIHRAAVKKMVDITEGKIDLLGSIQQIIWAEEEFLPAAGKIAYLQGLIPAEQDTKEKEQVEQFKDQYLRGDQQRFYQALEQGSLSLQNQVSGIVKALHFNLKTSDSHLMEAIEYFTLKDGKLDKNAPADFLSEEERTLVFPAETRFRISLYKALLFKSMSEQIKAGSLNLTYSYRYKAFDEYLILAEEWKLNKEQLLKEADLFHLKSCSGKIEQLKTKLDQAYTQSNQHILNNQNPHIRFHKTGKFHINTPAAAAPSFEDQALFPSRKIIPLSEILATVENLTDYLKAFPHLQHRHQRKRPEKSVFFAGITAYGCNLGIPTMADVAFPISEYELENSANWYFSLQNIDKANDIIVNFTQNLDLPNLYKEHQGKLDTSSDGQRITLNMPYALHGGYSPKYFRKGKGVLAYSFIDERYLLFYSTIIDPADREAIHVIDGLLHNESFHTLRHMTDSHGQTEAVFGLMNLLGFGFTPRIAKLHKQKLYSFQKRKEYEKLGYKILPDGYINTKIIEDNWDQILRLICSLKLKVCTAAQIFKRLNSYSRQHPLYQALKEFGKILKSLHILQYIDDLNLRQIIQKQLNKIERSHRFSNAVFFANGGEMIFPTRQEQRIAEACKRLIKSAIICWNYLYLSKKVSLLSKDQQRETLLNLIKAKSPMAWSHIYFHGLYDFSEEKLTDSYSLTNAQYLNLKIA